MPNFLLKRHLRRTLYLLENKNGKRKMQMEFLTYLKRLLLS